MNTTTTNNSNATSPSMLTTPAATGGGGVRSGVGNGGTMSPVLTLLKRDPKKTGVLVVLAVLLGFMIFRTFGPAKPQRAAAASSGTNAAAPANRPGSPGGPQPPTPRIAGVSPYLQKWAEPPVPPLSRNLFAVRLEYFPVEGPRNPNARVRERADDGFWARLEKSLVLQADQRDKKENQIAHYKAKAAQLKLQSTMMGPQPKALVNGELVGEGDVVAEFRVVKIEARRMIVEREGIRLEIQMK